VNIGIEKYWTYASAIIVLLGLYLTSLYSYLLFHVLMEIFGVVVAFGIFSMAWNSRRFMDNNYLLFLGIAYIFVGSLDLLHTMAYKGMGVFVDYSANLPTQLWIAARYLESLTLLIAPIFLQRRINISQIFIGYSTTFILVMLSIFYWEIFPNVQKLKEK